ncbi:uncharacterized protein LOC125292939 isoform X1 [Alosa alosa]|nr:uncharacterized protein LOC125292939 isoform X1 [Alosa alosa]
MEDEVEVRIKCFHALQCVLQYGKDTTEAVKVLQQHYVPLMLSLVVLCQSVEEQESCLRLLVSLSSSRASHPSVAHGLAGLSRLMAKRILYPEILILVVRILFNLSDNKQVVGKLFTFNVVPAMLRLLQPSNPKDTLLLCLGLLSNLNKHRPPLGGASDHSYNEESLLALLYFPESPLRSTLTVLTRHKEPQVKGSAAYMLSRMPRAITLPRPARPLRRGRARPGVPPSV